jgi:hypothetical protein
MSDIFFTILAHVSNILSQFSEYFQTYCWSSFPIYTLLLYHNQLVVNPQCKWHKKHPMDTTVNARALRN